MLLSRLTVAKMIRLSHTYLEPNHPAHRALATMPEVASLLPRLREAHQILVDSQSEDDRRADALQKEVAALAAEYDSLLFGIDCACHSLVLLTEDVEARAHWERLYGLLLPAKDKLADSHHKAIAGQAQRVQQLLGELPGPDRLRLREQAFGGRSLYDIILHWCTISKELDHKAQELKSLPVIPNSEKLQEARNQWALIVGTIVVSLQMAELLRELSPDLEEHVLGPLRAATESRAPRRAWPIESTDPHSKSQPASALLVGPSRRTPLERPGVVPPAQLQRNWRESATTSR